MTAQLPRLLLAALLVLGCALPAVAQQRQDSTWLPVWNNASGKLEAYLVLEPTQAPQVDNRWRFGNNSLDATYGLEAGDSLALLCSGKAGKDRALVNLPNNCLLAALGDRIGANGSRSSATAAFGNRNGRVGVTAGTGQDSISPWRAPGLRSQVEVYDLTVFAQKNILNEGFVSIAGTVAKARLVPASEAAPALARRWSSKSLTVGGGYGAFGASIVGHVVDTPGLPAFGGLGLGLTWRTPWSGQLTVGADNVVTRGKNPFLPGDEADGDGGTVPYVRYEQDL
jgi:hypothetical protein